MERSVYYNGKVVTCDGTGKCAEAFVVEDGKFVFVGSNEEAKKYGDGTDLEGKCVIPGLCDSHCHIISGCSNADMDMLFVSPEIKPEELSDAIIEEGLKSGIHLRQRETLCVCGIDLTKGDFNSDLFSKELQVIPVFVFSDDGHAILMNKKALERAGITKETEDPSEASYFSRDEEGNPTGLAIEVQAMIKCKNAFATKIGKKTEQMLLEMYSLYSSLGYTMVFDAMTSFGGGDTEVYDIIEKYKQNLNMRVVGCLTYTGGYTIEENLEDIKKIKEKYSSDLVSANVIKIIYDGTVEEHSAFMNEPYSDEPDNCGGSFLGKEGFTSIAEKVLKQGFDLHVHAIGDRSIEEVLDVFSSTDGNSKKIITHNQVYNEKSLKTLFENKNIFFQTTPHWVKKDEYTESFLGDERYKNQFPIGSACRNGINVSFGSDTAVDEELMNPFLGMYYAVTRGSGETYPDETEAISIEEALMAYTKNGAKQLGIENVAGSIEEGLSADFVILSDDILSIPKEEIKNITVNKTFFRGTCVFEK